MSAEYGWVANNVREFEVVLANGTVTQASATINPDLYAALKGGGPNYGIVTAFTLNAFPQDLVSKPFE
jgi:FAD/FMN-containing dehydrogenase